jgi:protein-tyrosine phosphatase
MGCGADYVTVESGGFIGPGRPSPNEARESAADRGIDLSDHRSSVIDATVVRMADLVVVMDRRQARRIRGEFPSSHASVLILGDLDPAPIARRAILDPVEQPRRVFDEVYERIDGCVDHAARVMCDQ